MEFRVFMEGLGLKEIKDRVGQVVFLDFKEKREEREYLAVWESLVKKEKEDHKAFKDSLVLMDSKGIRVTKETRVSKDCQFLVRKENMVCLAYLVYHKREKKDCQVCQASKVDLERQVLLVRGAVKVCLAYLDLLDEKENLGYLE